MPNATSRSQLPVPAPAPPRGAPAPCRSHPRARCSRPRRCSRLPAQRLSRSTMWLQALLFLGLLLLLLLAVLSLVFLRGSGSRNPFATDSRRPPGPLVTDKAVRRTVVKTGTGPPGPPTPAAGLEPGWHRQPRVDHPRDRTTSAGWQRPRSDIPPGWHHPSVTDPPGWHCPPQGGTVPPSVPPSPGGRGGPGAVGIPR